MSPHFDIESSGGTGVLAPPEPRFRRLPGDRKPAGPPANPPDDFDSGGGGGGGGGGWSGGGGEGEDAVPEKSSTEGEAGSLALGLVLAGVATLFTVLLSVWLLLRREATDWPPPRGAVPALGLWTATILLVASSLTLERGARLARRTIPGEHSRVLLWLGASCLLGIAFLAVQVGVLLGMWNAGHLPSTSGYGAVFYSLTGLHGLHVGGGLCYLFVLAGRLRTAGSFAVRRYGVRLAALFWHFMGLLWAILFTLLYFVR